ncbi:MAG: hypothetical protein ACRC4T_10695 [Cetobacterium sp.]
MNKICPRCRAVYSYSIGQCPNQCSSKAKLEDNRVYDRCQRDNKEFYSSKEWKRLRAVCKDKFSGLCLWSLYKHNKIKRGLIAHHIIPLSDDLNKGLQLSNLVYLSDEAHREIHKLYESEQQETIELIRKFIEVWEIEHGRGI